MRSRIPPQERRELVDNGLLDRRPVLCDVCGKPIEAGELATCNDGYDRIYGEFVLGEVDDLHEDNWPSAHAACAAKGQDREG